METQVDLLVSHSQIRLRSKPYVDAEHQWGKGNVDQGFLLHRGLIVADPLVEETVGATVIVRTADSLVPDPLAQRRVSLHFEVIDPAMLTVSSASEEYKIDLDVRAGPVQVVFEVCLDKEVYFVFTLLAPNSGGLSTALLDDGWGLQAGQVIREGKF